MKKISTSLLFILGTVAYAAAQTTAPDFTATDCHGNSHNLYTDLANGKTVVVAWVMPCSMCVPGSTAAFNAVQSFSAAHPGKVLYYFLDDAGDNTCDALGAWAKTNGLDTSKITIFDNAGPVIKQGDYGGPGMPHLMIVSGTDHKIYYNDMNGEGAGIQAALYAATGVTDVANQVNFQVAPNPVSEYLSVSYGKAISGIAVLSLSGQVVKEETYTKGKMNPSVGMSGVAAGAYMVKVTDIDGKSGTKKIVKQ